MSADDLRASPRADCEATSQEQEGHRARRPSGHRAPCLQRSLLKGFVLQGPDCASEGVRERFNALAARCFWSALRKITGTRLMMAIARAMQLPCERAIFLLGYDKAGIVPDAKGMRHDSRLLCSDCASRRRLARERVATPWLPTAELPCTPRGTPRARPGGARPA